MQGAIAEDEGGLAPLALTRPSATAPGVARPPRRRFPTSLYLPPSLESCIHAVVSRRAREKILPTIYLVGSVIVSRRFSFTRATAARISALRRTLSVAVV